MRHRSQPDRPARRESRWKRPQDLWNERAQRIWDDSSMYTSYPPGTAHLANRLGLHGVEQRARAEADDERWWNNRHERCPNNPRNGGQYHSSLFGGLDIKEDRRGSGWQYLEEYRERQRRERAIDPLTRGNRHLIDPQETDTP
jgi:hypothetical protein